MRFATYNVEWFYRLFDDDGLLLDDDEWSARYNVTRAEQAKAIATVLKQIDADGVMIIEAPDSSGARDGAKALENFAAHFGLRTNRAQLGFVNDTKQEIAFLYDPEALSVQHDPQESAAAPRFDGDHTTKYGLARWSKPPLELAVCARNQKYRLIGVHAKSKATHGAETHQEESRISRQNRQKQLAQCSWLRARIDAHLEQGDQVIVLGDFNDGPGMDQYEEIFGQSGVELVLGGEGVSLLEPHAAMREKSGAAPTTARFYISETKRFSQYLLDYVMVSPNIGNRSVWRIWHPFDDAYCWNDTELRDALLTASDHFPVSLDLHTVE